MKTERTQRDWDLFYLNLAKTVSGQSKDPSTKVGAVIVRSDKSISSLGYNGFPRGIADDERLYNRNRKYDIIIHGEINAILNSREPVNGCTLYTVPFAPCIRCAGIVIQSGIIRVVAPVLPENLKDRWENSLNDTSELFKEAGVELTLY